ncbi:MAG: hypothetical protein M0D55_01210 [Elusimicrobiota bacterium]|nr:MAG: hypothetical protein M0D55_01210 [Elusimicrobiota bacterium]
MRRATGALGAAALLGVCALLLFARLGHYSLWDDEAGTALTARGILLAGDTSAELGRNLFAVNGGAELEGLRLRYMPPLQGYLAAPLLALAPRSALAARLPFAACALALVALMLAWLRRTGAGPEARAAFAVALASCASFFLFGRQARYYAPAMLFSAAAAWQYAFWDGTRRRALALAGWTIALLATNYLAAAALWACLAADYALWGRKTRKPTARQWAMLILPPAAAAALLLSIWCPFGKSPVPTVGYSAGPALASFWYALRDMHRAQFLSLPLLAAAPLLWRLTRDARPVRAALAVLVYAAAVAALAPLPASGPRVAQIRYLAPLMPLGFALAALCAEAAPARLRRLALAALLLLCLPGLRTTSDFLGELAHPPSEPYAPAARWIAENVREGNRSGCSPTTRCTRSCFTRRTRRMPGSCRGRRSRASRGCPRFTSAAGSRPTTSSSSVPPSRRCSAAPTSSRRRSTRIGATSTGRSFSGGDSRRGEISTGAARPSTS